MCEFTHFEWAAYHTVWFILHLIHSCIYDLFNFNGILHRTNRKQVKSGRSTNHVIAHPGTIRSNLTSSNRFYIILIDSWTNFPYPPRSSLPECAPCGNVPHQKEKKRRRSPIRMCIAMISHYPHTLHWLPSYVNCSMAFVFVRFSYWNWSTFNREFVHSRMPPAKKKIRQISRVR